MEKYTMVKSEVQPNGDIFLYYVDENGEPCESNEGIISTIDEEQLQQLRENYVLEEMSTENIEVIDAGPAEGIQVEETEDSEQLIEDTTGKDRWLADETKKLLTFYTDNKEAFQNPLMKKKQLWTVACKTMLVGKQPRSCEMKLHNLKRKYALLYIDYLKNNNDPTPWLYYKQCHEAFSDDAFIKSMLQENGLSKTVNIAHKGHEKETNSSIALKKINKSPDEQVKHMLELYLKYKKEGANDYFWQKKAWDKIALEIGEDAEFWHKRFLNYKQQYIRNLEKRKECGTQSIIWPYMTLFDEIYANDKEFKQKYFNSGLVLSDITPKNAPLEWNDTEKTVLVKYYFDSLDEFQDPSIPNSFLWNEVGRLLDKKPDECKNKYEQMKKAHLMLYIGGGYVINIRKPVAILFDNIISQEVEIECFLHQKSAVDLRWSTEELDEMVQFLFDNIEVFKDPICHFVCWAAVSMKLQKSIQECKAHWNDLTALYKSILNDKKEDPDLQIDWRYIDIFDRIFDYGMDTKLLEGYENKEMIESKMKKIVIGGKIKPKKEPADETIPENLSDLEPEEFDERTSGKRLRGTGDPKQIKILEYYLRYKDKFATSQRKKQTLWEALASEIGISAEQCAHRFRNLKQVYTAYIQREIDKPDKPILWPYYALCKKVFGYRAIRSKLKQTKLEVGEKEEWTTREIKILINHYSKNFKDIDENPEELQKWATVAKELNKGKRACSEKFLELKKSYRKIKLMMSRTPDCKVNWKYFKAFEDIVNSPLVNVDSSNLPANIIKTEIADDDFQCIIVMPEGENLPGADKPQIIINNPPSTTPPQPKEVWTKAEKMELLQEYLNYLKAHKGKTITPAEMWQVLSSKLNRPAASLRKRFFYLKQTYKNTSNKKFKKNSLMMLLKEIVDTKAKFKKRIPRPDEFLNDRTVYTNIPMPLWIVEKGLKYYLEHVEEFVNPKYDKTQAWIGLAKSVSTPAAKMYKKINYLKHFFNPETNEVDGEKVEYADILKEILEKEFICTVALGNIPEPMETDQTEAETAVWSDQETEQLLQWYLENLDKFKNPKFVPSYLWMEAASVLNKSALACSQHMTEIRSQYSAMAKENPEALKNWRFYAMCQKIYGTGKKTSEQQEEPSLPAL